MPFSGEKTPSEPPMVDDSIGGFSGDQTSESDRPEAKFQPESTRVLGATEKARPGTAARKEAEETETKRKQQAEDKAANIIKEAPEQIEAQLRQIYSEDQEKGADPEITLAKVRLHSIVGEDPELKSDLINMAKERGVELTKKGKEKTMEELVADLPQEDLTGISIEMQKRKQNAEDDAEIIYTKLEANLDVKPEEVEDLSDKKAEQVLDKFISEVMREPENIPEDKRKQILNIFQQSESVSGEEAFSEENGEPVEVPPDISKKDALKAISSVL